MIVNGPVQSLADLAHFLEMATTQYIAYIVIFTVLVFLCLGLILWILLKLSVGSLFGNIVSMPADKKGRERAEGAKKKDHVEKRLEQERQNDRWVHSWQSQ